jgi:hypothetical protein
MSIQRRELLTRVVDTFTGEIVSETLATEEVKFKKLKVRPFFKAYIDDRKPLLELTGTECRYVIALGYIIDFNTNSYLLLKDDKMKLAEDLGVNVQTISNLNGSLVEKNVVKRITRGKFILNPDYIFRGNEANYRDAVIAYTNTNAQLDEDLANSKLNA